MTEQQRAGLQVRRARPSEAACAALLLRTAFAEIAPLYTPEALAATLADVAVLRERMATGAVWLAVLDGEPVGTLSAIPRTEGLHLRSMAVHPSARGQGVGKALLEVAEIYGRERGIQRVFLRTTAFLSSAIALYSRSGFALRPEGERDFHGVPLFEMEKTLVTVERAG